MNLQKDDPVILIRAATVGDSAAIWRVIEPAIRAGETYTLPRDFSKDDALGYWFSPDHEVFVAVQDGETVGSYYLRPNRAALDRISPIADT